VADVPSGVALSTSRFRRMLFCYQSVRYNDNAVDSYAGDAVSESRSGGLTNS
jgi:hypothetical protein